MDGYLPLGSVYDNILKWPGPTSHFPARQITPGKAEYMLYVYVISHSMSNAWQLAGTKKSGSEINLSGHIPQR